MTCSKAKKLMALYAGGDLSERRTRAAGAHLDSCPACRKELEGYRRALARVKAAAGAEIAPDWSEGEWRALMARVMGDATKRKKALAGRVKSVPRARWAAASGAAAALVLAAVMLLQNGSGFRPGSVATAPGAAEPMAGVLGDPSAQDVVSVTLVSQETGLQVVWFFNRNFEWKGDRE